jgi:hypothetical protein
MLVPAFVVQDIADSWSSTCRYGNTALQGWTKANANGGFTYAGAYGAGTVSINAYAGQYIPIRIVWGNVNTKGAFLISVTRPDGVVILTSQSVGFGSPLLVRFSCDQTTAPPFPYQFGAEV